MPLNPAVLPGEPLEQRRPAGRDRGACRVEHHPNQRVVAHQADGIEDPALAQLRNRAGIGGVADAAVLQQLRAEVIQRFLILCHAVRAAAVADRLGDLRIEATLDRERIVRGPLVRLTRLPPRDANDKFGEARIQGAVEAHVIAETPNTATQPRTPLPHIPGTRPSTAPTMTG